MIDTVLTLFELTEGEMVENEGLYRDQTYVHQFLIFPFLQSFISWIVVY